MNKNKYLIICLITINSLILQAALVSMPFSDNFDDNINSCWNGDGNIQTNIPAPREGTGSYFMHIEDNASLVIEDGDLNVWITFYAQMVPLSMNEDNPDISTNAATFFMKINGTTGDLWAYDSTNYLLVFSGLDTNAWHGFAVHLDFTNKTWNLYYKASNTLYSDPFTLLNDIEPMGMYTGFTASVISAFEASGSKTIIDNFAVMKSIQPIIPETSSFALATTYELILNDVASAIQFTYFGTEGNLNGVLGEQLEEVFSTGDKLYFWNGSTLIVSTLEVGGWDEDVIITPTTGFFIKRNSGITNTRTVTVSYLETYDHVELDAISITNDWNLLAVPYTAGSRSLSSLNLPESSNDQIFIRTINGWDILRYNGSTWLQGQNNANNYLIPAACPFWYRNRGGVTTWPTLD